MTRPIKIKIIGRPSEIRMGSPYNLCELDISGTSLDLPANGWQDKIYWSDNNKYLILIRWDFERNEPGFHFYIIDTEKDQLTVSKRILGLLNGLEIKNGKIYYNTFLLDRQKSKPGELCCNVDGEYPIEP